MIPTDFHSIIFQTGRSTTNQKSLTNGSSTLHFFFRRNFGEMYFPELKGKFTAKLFFSGVEAMLSCKQIPSKESIDLSSGERRERFGATDRISQTSASEYFYDLGSAVPVNDCKRLYIYIYI